MSSAGLPSGRPEPQRARCRLFFNPLNPLTYTPIGRSAIAVSEVFERATRRYSKPDFGIARTRVDGQSVAVTEEIVWQTPFCRLVHFKRDIDPARAAQHPRLLLVAPMSGHFATLLRGTVETFLPDHEVYITDWQDARNVPLSAGNFDLDDYIDTMADMFRFFGGDVHVFAVCQPSVPVLAAVALMEADGDPDVPLTLMLAGGPIDTRINRTVVNELAEKRGTDWFRRNVITNVPWPFPGRGRQVYPGFLQLSGFMTMNLDRHMQAHKDMFHHLVQRRRRLGRQASRVLRRVSRGDGPHGRILYADRRQRVRAASDAARAHDVARPARRSLRHPPAGADDGGRREGRHHRHRPVPRRARSVHRHSRRAQGALRVPQGRPLRRLQRLALPHRDRAAHGQVHARARSVRVEPTSPSRSSSTWRRCRGAAAARRSSRDWPSASLPSEAKPPIVKRSLEPPVADGATCAHAPPSSGLYPPQLFARPGLRAASCSVSLTLRRAWCTRP